MLFRPILYTLFVVMSYSTSIYANEADSLTTKYIEEVTISTSRFNREIIPAQILDGEQLEALSVHSVADAVRYFSGAQIKDFGGIGGLKTVDVRSLGSQHVGVFYDGIEMGNAQNGVVDLGRFSLDNIEAVSIYNAQKSGMLQSAKDFASASSIYLATRKPIFDDDKSYNLNIGLKGGSFKTINPSLLWEQRISPQIRSSISGEYIYTSGEYPYTYSKADGYDTTAIRQNGDVQSHRVEAALFGDMRGGEWQSKAYWYKSERGYPGASVREESTAYQNRDRQWDNNLLLQGSMRKRIGDRYSLKVSAKYANDYLRYLSDPTLNVSTLYVDNHYTQQELYGSIANMLSLNSWWSISLASDIQYNTLDADLLNFVYPERYTSLTSLSTSVDSRRVKLQGSLLYTFVDDITMGGESAENLNKLSPTVVLSYNPFDNNNFTFRTFYKRIFRMPTLNDLYYTFVGNVNLNPEYTTQYNVGATYYVTPKTGILRRFEVKADIYYNEVEDKIVAMPASNQFRWTMMNLGYVEIRGLDLVLDSAWRLGCLNITSRVNYTYQKAQDFTTPESAFYGGQIPYAPWHSGSVILGGDYREWRLNYSFIYTGERYESVANIAENYSQPWYTSDLSISRRFNINSVVMRVTAEVNNIFNQQYEVVQCYPMPGINYRLKLNIAF